MVHVNKLRKTIGRLEVKVALSIPSHHPSGVGQKQERGQGESILPRFTWSPWAAGLAEFESQLYCFIC
jgi:hypothetical protein